MSVSTSPRARDKRQAASHRQSLRPLVGQPVVHRFSAARSVACDQMNVPYGEVRVAGLPDSVRSHEIDEDGNRPCNANTAFIPQKQVNLERYERNAHRAGMNDGP